MSRFDQHLEEYRERKSLPAIHDGIARLIQDMTLDSRRRPGAIMDLGACQGLLAVRLTRMYPGTLVVAVEPSERYWKDRITHVPTIHWLKLGVRDRADARVIGEIARKERIELVVARRVFPEIAEAGGVELVTALGCELAGAGVKAIALEGRVPVKNARNPLSTADLECEALKLCWRWTVGRGACRWLVPA